MPIFKLDVTVNRVSLEFFFCNLIISVFYLLIVQLYLVEKNVDLTNFHQPMYF